VRRRPVIPVFHRFFVVEFISVMGVVIVRYGIRITTLDVVSWGSSSSRGLRAVAMAKVLPLDRATARRQCGGIWQRL
jgi:hypothetical protein